MKKFFVDTFICSLIVGILFVGIYSIKSGRLASLAKEMPYDTELICFGSSHGSAFNFSIYPVESTLINKGGNTYYYDLQNYYHLKKKLKPNAIVLLPVSYFSFGLDENRTHEVNEPFLNDFYEYLPKSSIHNYSYRKNLSVCLYMIQRNFLDFVSDEIEEDYEQLYLDEDFDFTKESIERKNKGHLRRLERNKHRKRDPLPKLKSHANKRGKTHIREGSYRPGGEKSLPYLEEIIRDCKESGFRPFLVTPPFYKHYNMKFNSAWLHKHFYRHVDYLERKHSIKHLDYSKDDRLSKFPLLFRNSDHMNNHGKTIFRNYFFSEFLLDELEKG